MLRPGRGDQLVRLRVEPEQVGVGLAVAQDLAHAALDGDSAGRAGDDAAFARRSAGTAR